MMILTWVVVSLVCACRHARKFFVGMCTQAEGQALQTASAIGRHFVKK